MRQDDFFLNQLDSLGKVLAKIISDLSKLKITGETIHIEPVNQTLIQKASLDLNEFISLPKEELIGFLHNEKNIKDDNFEKLAELFFILGKETISNDTQKSTKLLERSLVIFEYVNTTSNLYSMERITKIETLKNTLHLH